MSLDANKQLIRRVIHLFNARDWEHFDAIYTPDCIVVDPGKPADMNAAQYVAQLCGAYDEAFPDLQYRLDDIIAEGDLVATHWTATGTHTGRLEIGDITLFATEKPFEVSAISMDRIRDGRIVQTRQIVDFFGFFMQLDLIAFKQA
jgi:steroid delta-isomerase-like uncharacterized protein